VAVIGFGSSIWNGPPVAVHPLLSVTVTEYGPAHNPVAGLEVLPSLHEKVYGAVPPVGFKVTLPSQKALQEVLSIVGFNTIVLPLIMV